MALKNLKNEKKRKVSLLYDQLEKTRKDLLQVRFLKFNTVVYILFKDNSMRLHDMQKGEKHDLKKNLEIDLKLLQKLQVRLYLQKSDLKLN